MIGYPLTCAGWLRASRMPHFHVLSTSIYLFSNGRIDLDGAYRNFLRPSVAASKCRSKRLVPAVASLVVNVVRVGIVRFDRVAFVERDFDPSRDCSGIV